MGLPQKHALSANAERRAMVALFAVFALLVQALIPALATAAPMSGPGLVICTQDGVQDLSGKTTPGQPASEHACKHCLCPAPTTAPPSPTGVQRIAYASRLAVADSGDPTLPPPARAPPRPPGQGPPTSNA